MFECDSVYLPLPVLFRERLWRPFILFTHRHINLAILHFLLLGEAPAPPHCSLRTYLDCSWSREDSKSCHQEREVDAPSVEAKGFQIRSSNAAVQVCLFSLHS